MAVRRRIPRLKGLSINRLIPNILTLLALCCGLTAIRFGLQGRWEAGVTAILLAGVLDGLDGRIARLLRGTSKFGAELDSLSDFVSFGVAPAVLLYLWSMQGAGSFGWALVLLFSVCCALRLARFNTMLGQPDLPPWAYNFFTGVPTPAGAALVMLPMMLFFEWGGGFFDRPVVVAVFLVLVSFLMVSRIPTFSLKGLRVPHHWVLPVLLVVGLLAAFLVTAGWVTLIFFGFLYIASFPFSIRAYRQLERTAHEIQTQESPIDPPANPGT
ncbi:MAG: CDP-diacylglycerol--serine O-phosphatidyltransferase [Rhodospirillales bacterium]|nr:CDP-diacylglycerol--serine O-phosphatidyltransferase [Rhodospirillales bacterium]